MVNKVLKKRIFRDLKANFLRYIALILLIVLGIFIVVSMAGAADVIIEGTNKRAVSCSTEDGEFNVFIPLSDRQISDLKEEGINLEKMFSVDSKLSDGSVLRITENRNDINKISVDKGKIASSDEETLIEKRYAKEHGLKVGDKIEISGKEYTICGIGSVPDYEMPLRKSSDSSIDSKNFGLAFFTENEYENIKNSSGQMAEDYTYAYMLEKNVSDDDVRDKIKNLEFNYKDVEDTYFQNYIKDLTEDKNKMTDAVNDIYDGVNELNDGLKEVSDNSDELVNVADSLFDVYLQQLSASLDSYGFKESLTRDNYKSKLDEIILYTNSQDIITLKSLFEQIDKFCTGIKEYTDSVGTAYEGSEELRKGVYDFKEETESFLDENFKIDIDNLKSFTKTEDNHKIAAASNDVQINKSMSLTVGIVVIALFTYVISVFVSHQIQRESSVIGSLYALGVKKRSLLIHYITLPVIITFVSGAIGTLIGFSSFGIGMQMQDSYNYFSLPEFDIIHPVYLLVYGLIVPPVICIIVNVIVINKQLSRTALSLMRNEQKNQKYSKANIKSKNFIKIFRIRQLLRESRSVVIIIVGIFISVLIMTLGIDIWALCSNIKDDTIEDTKYNYMYMYKYPEKTVPNGGEAVYTETLSKTHLNNTLDVTLMGISENNKYFNAEPSLDESSVVVSNGVAERYGVSEGDIITLTDKVTKEIYAFRVEGVCQYAVSFTVFMNIDNMRELFGKTDDYYNVVVSEKKLDIDDGRLYSLTTREDVEKASDVFIKLMTPTIYMLIVVSIIIFCVVLYLMMGVMIDRSAFGISLMKVFGYRSKEIKKLYINGNTIIVLLGAYMSIILSKVLVDAYFPNTIANVACEMNLSFPIYVYIMEFALVTIAYFAVNTLLIMKINKVTLADVIKNRD